MKEIGAIEGREKISEIGRQAQTAGLGRHELGGRGGTTETNQAVGQMRRGLAKRIEEHRATSRR
jgi:hypothetical protein